MQNLKAVNKSSSNQGSKYVGESTPHIISSATTSVRQNLEQDARSEFPLRLPTNRRIIYESPATRSTPSIHRGAITGNGIREPDRQPVTAHPLEFSQPSDDFAIVTTQEFDDDNYELRLCKVEGSMRSTDDSLHPPEMPVGFGGLPTLRLQSELHMKPNRLYLPMQIPSAPKLPPKRPVEQVQGFLEEQVSPDPVYSTPPKKNHKPVFFGRPSPDPVQPPLERVLFARDEPRAKPDLLAAEINKKTCIELRTGQIKHSSEYLDLMLSEEF